MLRVSLIAPEATRYDGDATAVVAPAFDGQVGILTGHAPMMTLLGRGTLRLTTPHGEELFTVSGGFLQVVDSLVRVVTERATRAPAPLP